MSKVEDEQASDSGVDLIAAERQRQIEVEGWTPEHDARHRGGELTSAASCYLWLANKQIKDGANPYGADIAPNGWPWAASWWKPSDDPLRNLVKAGALIAAEIDRLQRVGPDGTVTDRADDDAR